MTSEEVILARIERLEKIVKKLQNNAAPTLPIYDSANFPQDAVEGQIVIADA
jgi:hypothetical protein